jgi:hypothetical protein
MKRWKLFASLAGVVVLVGFAEEACLPEESYPHHLGSATLPA